MTSPKLSQGNVSLTLGNDTYTLKPTIGAFQQISGKHGGLAAAMNKIAMLDLEAIMDCVMAGLGPTYAGPKRRMEFAERVFAEGVSDQTGGIAAACGEYILVLMNGGKRVTRNTEDLADGAPDEGN